MRKRADWTGQWRNLISFRVYRHKHRMYMYYCVRSRKEVCSRINGLRKTGHCNIFSPSRLNSKQNSSPQLLGRRRSCFVKYTASQFRRYFQILTAPRWSNRNALWHSAPRAIDCNIQYLLYY